jgi:hypothetical protein
MAASRWLGLRESSEICGLPGIATREKKALVGRDFKPAEVKKQTSQHGAVVETDLF